MSDLVEKHLALMRARAEELRREVEPLLSELEELEGALAAFRSGPSASQSKRLPASVRKDQIIELVTSEPGIRVRDVAERLDLSVPRIVQLVNALESEKRVVRGKDGLQLAK